MADLMQAPLVENDQPTMVVLDEEKRLELIELLGDESECEVARRELLDFLQAMDEGERVDRKVLEGHLDWFIMHLGSPNFLAKQMRDWLRTDHEISC